MRIRPNALDFRSFYHTPHPPFGHLLLKEKAFICADLLNSVTNRNAYGWRWCVQGHGTRPFPTNILDDAFVITEFYG